MSDRGLDHATRAAQEAARSLVAGGSVRLVTGELARLDEEAERAERQEQTAARLDAQRAAHRAEGDESTAE